jgi:16S rRNA processing protein RimM
VQPDAFVTIARVAKVQGRVGEVAVELHTDFPERFEQRRRLYAWQKSGERRELQLEDYWPHKGGMVLKFAGVDSIEAARELLGAEIQIPVAERAELEEGAVYVSELLGCVVESGGCAIGSVTDVSFAGGAAPLLIVSDAGGREQMIPFVESFIRKLDTAGKKIEMELPEGMLELDAPVGKGKSQGQGSISHASRKTRGEHGAPKE